MRRLYVYVLEGWDWPVDDSFLKLQVGKFKSKTRVLRNTRTPVWNEEFAFRVHSLEDDDLVVSVYHHDDEPHGFFHASSELVARFRIPVLSVAAEENQNMPPTWFSLEKPKGINFMPAAKKDCGKILLSLSLHGRCHNDVSNAQLSYLVPSSKKESSEEWDGAEIPSQHVLDSRTSSHKTVEGKQLMKAIAGRFERLFKKNEEATTTDESSDVSTSLSDYEDCLEVPVSSCSFEESLGKLETMTQETEIPENLLGGILIDQTYLVPSKDLNQLLFAPDSQFRKDLAELLGSKDVEEGPWTWKSEDKSSLTRVVSYIKAATKLVRAVKATEEQAYIKADGKEFAIFVSVNTPDVPYGATFKVELLYKIMPGPELAGEESSHLVISWGIKFCQSTMVKGMIEGGARQGLKESFDQFANLLAQNCKTMSNSDVLDKDNLLATLEIEHQSDWELAMKYFCNFTVASTIFMTLYFFVHILLCEPSKIQGLEFYGFDLPDTFGEFVTCAIFVLQLQRVYEMASHFVQARLQRGNDHGVKAQGDGWVLTVALIEGTHLASLDLSGFPDPYVVLTCNGKTRTSSVKLQTIDPQWNEVLEFDAADELPSVLEAEVFDFDGPFDQATSLGHTEINFLRHTSAELADMWVPLEGKLAQSFQSKLHLRIFLDNNKGVDTIRDYLTKVEKEAGKKLNIRSPHRNSTFQKHFGLPPEEFLVSDFSCSLKRRLPLQGRLFLSARIVGFYANLFGHKTRFFFLWEDVEDIQVLPPSLSSMGSPILVMVLRKDRGLDASYGAKSLDEEGRLRFYFHSFVSFHAANRTIMALWRTRTLGPDQKAQIAAEHQEQEAKCVEDGGSCLIVEELKMHKVYSAEIPVNVESLMEMFGGGNLEHKVMGRFGCLNFVASKWEASSPNVLERRLCYKFNRRVSTFGGEVSCTQQKCPSSDGRGWTVKEIMCLHDVPFGDYFRVQLTYEVQESGVSSSSCKCDVYVGGAWTKSTKFEQRITRNIISKFTQRLKELFVLVEREILLAGDGVAPPDDCSTAAVSD